MIDAYQATIVAGIGDVVVHWSPDCIFEWDMAADLWRENGEQYGMFDHYVEDLTGLEPTSRFTIHEIESANWEDVGYHLDFETSDIEYDYDTETAIIKVDVSTLVGVFCDQCGERIE